MDALPTHDLVLAQFVDALTVQFKAATKYRVGAKRVHALHQAAVDSIGVPEGQVTARLQLASYLRSWRAAIEAEQATILADLSRAAPLSSIPGFGSHGIATLRGELGDLSRFADPRQSQKMAGLNLPQTTSGHHQGPTHIAKRGWPAHPLPPKAAMIAVATKLLRVAWACLKHGHVYDASRLYPPGEVTDAA